MKAVILAAGVGSRLGSPVPKPLTRLTNGVSIMEQQIASLTRHLSTDDVLVVVGHKKELIMEEFPELTYAYNPRFDATNTSKSLLLALSRLRGHDVVWLNGDVVFEPEVLDRLIASTTSAMAVKYGTVGEEEVKVRTDSQGWITAVSKTVIDGEGEAIGINLVKSADGAGLLDQLKACAEQDYFERAIESAIKRGARFQAVDVSELRCTEVDFVEDLERANREIRSGKRKQVA